LVEADIMLRVAETDSERRFSGTSKKSEFVKMSEVSIEQLQSAVERTHNCVATYRKPVQINEEFHRKTIWTGTVYEFDVNHPVAKTCYAWTATTDDAGKQRYFAVLGIPPVNSARDAVSAALATEGR
jgi:hypothetical protein